MPLLCWLDQYYVTLLQWSWKRGILVSACPSMCLCICWSVDKIMSTLHFQQYLLDPFQFFASFQATSEGVLYVKIFTKLQNLKFFAGLLNLYLWLWLVLTWNERNLIWIDRIGLSWGGRGYSQNAGLLVALVSFYLNLSCCEIEIGQYPDCWCLGSLHYQVTQGRISPFDKRSTHYGQAVPYSNRDHGKDHLT